MSGLSVDMSRQIEPEAKSAHLLLRLRKLPLNCGFVLIGSYDSFVLLAPAGRGIVIP